MKKTSSKQTFDFTDEGDSAPSSFGVIARNNSVLDQSVSSPLAGEKLIDVMIRAIEKLPPLPDSVSKQLAIDSKATSEQTVSKDPLATREPIVSKPLAVSVSNSKANREHTVSNPEAISEQFVNQPLAKKAEDIQSVSNPSSTSLANREQFVSHQLAEDPVSELVGKEKKLLLIIYEKCEANGSLESPVITTEDLMVELDVSPERLRNLVFRLKDKNVITVIKNKSGKGGWRKFYLRKDIFQAIRLSVTSSNSLAIREQSVSNPSSIPLATPLAKAPYSSSDFLNDKKNTNTIGVPENLKALGVSAINLQRIVETGKCSFEIVQKSVDAISFDVSRGKKGSIANILFGVLNSGREYISQGLTQELAKELEGELQRISEAEEVQRKLAEMSLVRKWEGYKAENPTWIDVYRAKFSHIMGDEGLETVAFEEFKKEAGESD